MTAEAQPYFSTQWEREDYERRQRGEPELGPLGMRSLLGEHQGPLTALDMAKAETVIVLNLDVKEQRRVVEHMAGGACFRMRITEPEYVTYQAAKEIPKWQFATLTDGSHVMWQPYRELTKLRKGPCQNMRLWHDIMDRMIGDEVE